MLPELPYEENSLEPTISKEQLSIHYNKHHKAYVDGANRLLEKLEMSRKDKSDVDLKSILKELSFNIGGHILHSLFWYNIAPKDQCGIPDGVLLKTIMDEFGSLERFKEEFTKVALSVEGSGWAALTFCNKTRKPIIMQIEKHNANLYPTFEIIMVLDVFEHAYYLDYKNDRAKYVESIWDIINWKEVRVRLEDVLRSNMLVHDSKSREMIKEHLRNHVIYPINRSSLLKTFGSMVEFSKEQNRWIEMALPQREYSNSKDVIDILGL